MPPIDPTRFHPHCVADTCSVWNLLSSRLLRAAARDAGCHFCITSFVRYECLVKPRTIAPTSPEEALRNELRAEVAKGAIESHSLTLDDLQEVARLETRRKLGAGELSTIAFAMRIGQAALSDDGKAIRLAIEAGHTLAQTTPQLLGWLIFTRRLGDADKSVVIAQHAASGRGLGPHLERAYERALACQLALAPRRP